VLLDSCLFDEFCINFPITVTYFSHSSFCFTCMYKQDKTAFIFCVEDRALFCENCDESIHLPGSLSANHQRFLATGIQVAMKSNCAKDDEKTHLEPPKKNTQQVSLETPSQQVPDFTPPWGVDDLLELADFNSHGKVRLTTLFHNLNYIYVMNTNTKFVTCP